MFKNNPHVGYPIHSVSEAYGFIWRDLGTIVYLDVVKL
jgi:hypothetical protein